LPAEITGRLDVTAQPATLQATGTVVSLEDVAQREVGGSRSIAERDADLRDWVAKWVIPFLIGASTVSLLVVGGLAWFDHQDLRGKFITPADRIITSQVIMALLGATTVQVGVIAPPALDEARGQDAGEQGAGRGDQDQGARDGPGCQGKGLFRAGAQAWGDHRRAGIAMEANAHF
jgi:hypothetical protein